MLNLFKFHTLEMRPVEDYVIHTQTSAWERGTRKVYREEVVRTSRNQDFVINQRDVKPVDFKGNFYLVDLVF